MLQAGVTISIIPCVLVYLLLQRYYVSGPAQRSRQVTREGIVEPGAAAGRPSAARAS